MYSRMLLIFALTSGTAFAQATSLPAEQESVQSLIERIQQNHTEEARIIRIPCELKIRESTQG